MTTGRQRYSADPVLYRAISGKTFIGKLDVPRDEIGALKSARKEIRQAIKTRFRELSSILTEGRAFAGLENIQENESKALRAMVPRFWPQGSFVYGTMNAPAQPPAQQIDIDDGVYLPMDVFDGSPVIAKNLFFKIVDGALMDLAESRGWGFMKKDTCARLIISNRAHVDVPLYAIPEKRFLEIQEARVKAQVSLESFDEYRDLLNENEVHLAVRSAKHWVVSDPMKIQRWFKGAKSRHSRLQRVCRYLKAWRDHVWESGGPSSIVLMVCATRVFDEQGEPFTSDTAALLAVSESLPGLLNGGTKLYNPADPNELMYPREKDMDHVQDIATNCTKLASALGVALRQSDECDDVIQGLRSIFGERMPSRPEAVEELTISAAVKSTQPERRSEPSAPSSMRSGSGHRSG